MRSSSAAVFAFLLTFAVPSLSLSATAQEKAAAEAPAPKTTAEVVDASGEKAIVSVKELDLLLLPMTKTELEVEVQGWLRQVQDRVRDKVTAEIEAAHATDTAARDAALQRAITYDVAKTKTIDRLNTALRAYAAKGGKTDDYDKYVAAVSGMSLDASDVSGSWAKIVGWLQSPEGGIRYGKNILLFVLTLIVFAILGRIAGGLTRRTVGGFKHSSELLRDFIVNVVRKVVVLIGLVVALSMLEVNVGPFVAAIGAVGFVVGFALQGTLSNFAAGVMILLYRPYDIGNDVTVAGAKGKVTSMTLVSTVLRTPDNQTVIVPNGSIWNGVITNHTTGEVSGAQVATART